VKRNKNVLIAVVAAVGALLWYVALFAPARTERSALGEQVTAAERKEEELHATRVRLRALEAGRAAHQAQLKRLQRLVPPEADMAGFLLAANHAAVRSGVDWVSVAPAAAVAGVGGQPSAIAVSIAVNGGFFTILDYLRILEDLGRLVVVDSLQLAPGGQGAGPLQLSATISARIFTSATVAPAPGAPAVVPPPDTAALGGG
jgi:Tfp pilus assembly protein PilO